MFACELNGVIDNFFNDADIDIQLMSRLKSVDISRNVSPQLRKLDNDKIDEILKRNKNIQKISNKNQNLVESYNRIYSTKGTNQINARLIELVDKNLLEMEKNK